MARKKELWPLAGVREELGPDEWRFVLETKADPGFHLFSVVALSILLLPLAFWLGPANAGGGGRALVGLALVVWPFVLVGMFSVWLSAPIERDAREIVFRRDFIEVGSVGYLGLRLRPAAVVEICVREGQLELVVEGQRWPAHVARVGGFARHLLPRLEAALAWARSVPHYRAGRP